MIEITTDAPEATEGLGRRLGRVLPSGSVLGVRGTLGAGKTCFVRGLASGLEVDPELVYSPSFTLIAEHEGRMRLSHVDLFRLADPIDPADAEALGLPELLAPEGVTVVEWPERLGEPLATGSFDVEIVVGEGDSRTLRIAGPATVLARLREEIDAC